MEKASNTKPEWASLKEISIGQWLMIIGVTLVFVAGFMLFEHRLGYRYDIGRLNNDTILYYIFYLLKTRPAELQHTFLGQYRFPTLYFVSLISPLISAFGLVQALVTLEAIIGVGYILLAFISLYILTGYIGLSLAVAIFSVFPVLVFPVESWAILSFPSMLPRTLFSVFYPPLFLGWLRWRQNPKLLLVLFFLIGLLSNIYPLTGLTMVSAMLLAQVVIGRFSWRAIGLAAMCGLASLIPMLPFAIDFISYMRHAAPQGPGSVNPAELQKAFDYRLGLPTFSADQFAILFSPLAWMVFGGLGLASIQRSVKKDILFFIGATLFIFGFIVALNYLWLIPHGRSPFLLADFLRAPRQLVLPLVMMAALYIAQQSKCTRRLWLTVLLGLSVIFIDCRTLARDIISHAPLIRLIPHQIDSKKKEYGLSPSKQHKFWRKANMYDVALWFKNNTSQAHTLVHVSPVQQNDVTIYILAFGCRAVTLDWNFFGTLYYADRAEYVAWYRLFSRLNAIFQEKGSCSPAELQLITQHYPTITHVVCSTPVLSPMESPLNKLVYRNADFYVYEMGNP